MRSPAQTGVHGAYVLIQVLGPPEAQTRPVGIHAVKVIWRPAQIAGYNGVVRP